MTVWNHYRDHNQLVFVPVYDVNSPTIFRHAEDLAWASKVITFYTSQVDWMGWNRAISVPSRSHLPHRTTTFKVGVLGIHPLLVANLTLPR